MCLLLLLGLAEKSGLLVLGGDFNIELVTVPHTLDSMRKIRQ
jgi:hypothetical protein